MRWKKISNRKGFPTPQFACKQRNHICPLTTTEQMLCANIFYARSTNCRKTGSILFIEFISSIDVHLMTHLFSVKRSISVFLFYSFDSCLYSWMPTMITDLIHHQLLHWNFFHSSFRKTHLFWFFLENVFPLYSLASSTDHKQGGQLHTLEREETWTGSLNPTVEMDLFLCKCTICK